MASNKKNSNPSETEYEYSGEDGGQETFVDASKRPSFSLAMLKEKFLERLPKKKTHKILLFVGVAIYVLYKFLDVGTPPPASSTSASGKIASQQLTKPPAEETHTAKQPEKKTAPATTATVPAAVTSTANSKESIFSKTNTNEKEVNAQVKELQSHLDQINQSVNSLESSLLNLTSSVIRLADKVNALEKMREKSKQAMVIQPTVLPIYYLQSLVTGRAWVESPLGDLVTVKVGDALPGYGKIQRIDIRTGTLVTTSGRLISYGPNDS